MIMIEHVEAIMKQNQEGDGLALVLMLVVVPTVWAIVSSLTVVVRMFKTTVERRRQRRTLFDQWWCCYISNSHELVDTEIQIWHPYESETCYRVAQRCRNCAFQKSQPLNTVDAHQRMSTGGGLPMVDLGNY